MTIELNRPFSADSAKTDEFDVRQMKKALNRLGYYRPSDKAGITGVPDAAVFNALKAFQADMGLPATGKAKPNDETMRALSREFSGKKSGQYIWRTVDDDRVRGSHAALNGTLRNFADSPDPGDEFNCRCWAELVDDKHYIYDPPVQPVYPELLLLPLLRARNLYLLWKTWLNSKDATWTLGAHKSDIRWGNQLRNRNWTPEQIDKTIKLGTRYSAPNKVNPGNQATRYEYEGRFVVRDDTTKEIIQISGRGDFKPNY